MTHRISRNRLLSMPLRGCPPHVAALVRGSPVGVAGRLNIFERHVVARTCTLERLEGVLRREETDGIVSAVHNVNAVVTRVDLPHQGAVHAASQRATYGAPQARRMARAPRASEEPRSCCRGSDRDEK